MEKYLVVIIVCVLSGFTLQSKTWITDVKNNSNQRITIQSNDPTAKNSTMNKARNGWDPNYKNPIAIDPGQSVIFNDFVVGWKSHDARVNVMTQRGDYTLQEDNNSVFLTSPGSSQRLEIFQRQGGDRTIGITVNADGSLNAYTIV